jgi:hypothetical protein
MEQQYNVTISNSFDADSPEDALRQMVAYLVDYAPQAGYRVTNMDTAASVFLDAEDVM